MKETHTPRKDLSHRRPKDYLSTKSSSISDLPKMSQKAAKKNLNAVFSSVSEELLSDSVAESFNFSPISEILSDSNINHNGELIDNFECLFAGEDALTSSDSSTSFKINVRDCDNFFTSDGNVETEVVANLLKQARAEVSSSFDVSPVSKKLIDSLVEVYVKEFCDLSEEKDIVNVLISEKTRVVVFCFALWLITMTVILIVLRSSSNRDIFSFYLPPT